MIYQAKQKARINNANRKERDENVDKSLVESDDVASGNG
jgi:hypothetical protein